MPGVDLSNLPRISCFNEALAWWEDRRHELTGREQYWGGDVVPLDGKRKKHVRMMRRNTDNSFLMVLYRTPMVRYMPSGVVEINTYNSLASRDFLNKLAPEGVRPHMFKGEMWLCVQTSSGPQYLRPKSAYLTLIPDSHEEGLWVPYHYARRQVAKIKYRSLPRIRRIAQPIQDWLKTYYRLGGQQIRNYSPPSVDAIRQALTTQSGYAQVFSGYDPQDIVGLVALAEGVVEINEADYSRPPGKNVPGEVISKLTVLRPSQELEYV